MQVKKLQNRVRNFWMGAIPWQLLLCAIAANAQETRDKPINFVRDIRPILSRNCFECHGPDEGHRKGDLRLDTQEGAFAKGAGHQAFIPGKPDESEAFARMISTDPTEQMPPPKSGKSLTPEQQELIRKWIEEGANWGSHWSFEKPVRVPPPAIKDRAWATNGIDHFVYANLQDKGLVPSPEAEKAVLARRVALDLTGIPAPPDLVAAYLKDTTAQAYENFVDKLLQSPAYGERWARIWLDLARYADTRGYEKDRTRTLWRYRDWVIDAFNSDLPYDQFTRDQLAGDLLPEPTSQQLLATAFHRNTMVNEEGGTDDEEFRIAAVKDRVDTTMQVWMGLTMGCAKCHSHKYDPISQREYFQFYAFFNQTADNDRGDEFPTMPSPTPEQLQIIDKLKSELAVLQDRLRSPTPEWEAGLRAWESSQQTTSGWVIPKPIAQSASSGSTLKVLDDMSLLAEAKSPAVEQYTVTIPYSGKRITAVRLEAIPDKSHPKSGVGRSPNDGNFVLTGIHIQTKTAAGQCTDVPLAKAEADFSQDNYPVALAIKNDNPKKQGWAVSPRQTEQRTAVFSLEKPLEISEPVEITVTLDHQFEFSYPGFSMGRFRISVTDAPNPALSGQIPDVILAILRLPADQRNVTQQAELWKHFAQLSPLTKSLREEIARKQAEIASHKPVETPILRELEASQQRVTNIHVRGNFLEKGEVVTANTPSAFHKWPEGAPLNRLGVAQWLTSPENPLTTRVAVNRLWAQFFGVGLVETQEDFGSQGQPPSMPELLDWLAIEFVDRGWSMKQMCKTIVMSSTYRQTSRVTPELLEKDRYNRLLARGPRFRLEAEMLRDQALAVAGVLSKKMYGPSVMPPQPDGIWRSTYNVDKWRTSPGEDKFRRGLYTFIKRTSPYPSMITFDAPSRETCTIRRINTNTPLQALVLLNDPVYVESAAFLARRVSTPMSSTEKRIAEAFQAALVREIQPTELQALVHLFQLRKLAYVKDGAAAEHLCRELLGHHADNQDFADLAALTAVCNVILNLDEFVSRG